MILLYCLAESGFNLTRTHSLIKWMLLFFLGDNYTKVTQIHYFCLTFSKCEKQPLSVSPICEGLCQGLITIHFEEEHTNYITHIVFTDMDSIFRHLLQDSELSQTIMKLLGAVQIGTVLAKTGQVWKCSFNIYVFWPEGLLHIAYQPFLKQLESFQITWRLHAVQKLVFALYQHLTLVNELQGIKTRKEYP